VTTSAVAGGEVSPSPFELPPPTAGARVSKTLSQKRLARDARLDRKRLGPKEPPVEAQRPKTRGDCFGGERPCPFVGCRYHTYLDITPAGSLVINRPDVDVAELKASCSLDIADAGPQTLEATGAVMNVTRERMRQLEAATLEKVRVRFAGSCRAVCALSGRTCKLPAHGVDVKHRHERGPFHLVALDGQTVFPERERLEREARRNPEGMPLLEASHV